MKIILYYAIGAALIEISSWLLVLLNKKNMFLFPLSLYFQFLILSVYFYKLIRVEKFRKIQLFFIISVVVFLLIRTLFNPELLTSADRINYALVIVPLIICCVYAFGRGLLNEDLYSYTSLNYGMILYLSSSSVIFLSRDILINDLKLSVVQFKYVYIFNNLIYVFFLTIILFTIWKQTKRALT